MTVSTFIDYLRSAGLQIHNSKTFYFNKTNNLVDFFLNPFSNIDDSLSNIINSPINNGETYIHILTDKNDLIYKIYVGSTTNHKNRTSKFSPLSSNCRGYSLLFAYAFQVKDITKDIQFLITSSVDEQHIIKFCKKIIENDPNSVSNDDLNKTPVVVNIQKGNLN